MKILVVHGRVRNLGDRAIAVCMKRQLADAFPGCELVYDADEPELMRKHLPGVDIVPAFVEVEKISLKGGSHSVRYFFDNALYFARVLGRYAYAWFCAVFGWSGSLVPIVKAYRDADLVVWAGGDYVSGVYGPRYRLFFWELSLAKRMGKPVAIYAQTVGPFTEGQMRVARVHLPKADLVLARDDGTEAILRTLGVTGSVRRVADTVLLLEPEATPAVEEAASRCGFDEKTIGFAFIDQAYSGVSDDDYAAYEKGMASLIAHAVEKGCRPVLFGASPEDLRRAKKAAAKFGFDELPIIDMLEYEPSEMKSMLSRLLVLVSSRMHPIILATGAGVPVLGINKLPKMRDYLVMAGLGDFHLPLEGLNDRLAAALLDTLIARNAEVRDELARKIAALKKESVKNAEEVRLCAEAHRISS